MATKRELLEAWIQRVWRNQEVGAIYEYFVPEGPARGLGECTINGPKEFEGLHEAVLRLVTDVDIELTHVVEEGEWISYMGVFRATDRKTGKRVEMTGGAICLYRDDKMLEAHNAWDFLSFFGQLGLIPEDAFVKALSGQKV